MKKLKLVTVALLFIIFSSITTHASSLPPVYFPAHYHRIAAISMLGDTLELEDGSVWSISPSDSYKIFQWKSLDSLVLKPNQSWFSSYDYKILNNETHEIIEVNLQLSPIVNGEYTNYIIDLDLYKSELSLQDHSRWKIHRNDRKIFDQWAYDDLIIIGVYDGGIFSSDSFILINVNMNNYCRVNRI